MSITHFHTRLTLERCRMHVAQLCAATHLHDEGAGFPAIESDVLETMLRGLSQDLCLLERLLGETAE